MKTKETETLLPLSTLTWQNHTFILTAQMIRDKLVFNGPSTISELMQIMKLEEEFRSKVHVGLVALMDKNQVTFDVNTKKWTCTVSI